MWVWYRKSERWCEASRDRNDYGSWFTLREGRRSLQDISKQWRNMSKVTCMKKFLYRWYTPTWWLGILSSKSFLFHMSERSWRLTCTRSSRELRETPYCLDQVVQGGKNGSCQDLSRPIEAAGESHFHWWLLLLSRQRQAIHMEQKSIQHLHSSLAKNESSGCHCCYWFSRNY